MKRVGLIEYLRLIFDKKLNWSCHAKQVSTHLAKRSGILYRLHNYVKENLSICFIRVLVIVIYNKVYKALLRKHIHVKLSLDKIILGYTGNFSRQKI